MGLLEGDRCSRDDITLCAVRHGEFQVPADGEKRRLYPVGVEVTMPVKRLCGDERAKGPIHKPG